MALTAYWRISLFFIVKHHWNNLDRYWFVYSNQLPSCQHVHVYVWLSFTFSSCHTHGRGRPQLLSMMVADCQHDDVIKWKHFPRYRPYVRRIHRSPVNSPHKGQWRRTLMFSLIFARINGWVKTGEIGDLRRHHAHYDVIVMENWIPGKCYTDDKD